MKDIDAALNRRRLRPIAARMDNHLPCVPRRLQSAGNRVAFRHEIRSQDRQGRRTHRERRAPKRASRTADVNAQPTQPGRAKARGRGAKRGYLDGQMLIAMPTMGDERFARSVIYICAHSSEGAMGIIVNQPAAHISFADLLVQLDVIPALRPDPAAVERRRREGAQGRPGRDRARLRAAFDRLLHRELDAADRRRHLPHRDARHPQGDRARRRPGQRGARARLCRLGAGPARERDPPERLAALLGRFRAGLRRRTTRANTPRR